MKQSQVKQVQDLVIGQLDGLKALVENTLKEWGETDVPLNFLATSIKKAKINPRKQNIKAARDFFLNFNKTLSKIEQLCKTNAKTMGKDHVPLTVFNTFLDHTKKIFLESSNKNIS